MKLEGVWRFTLQNTACVLSFACAWLLVVVGAAEGPGQVPAMGWNSWNSFRCAINETIVREVADALVSSGLADAGFKYVNVDDCWAKARGDDGIIVVDEARFPSGMKALAEYVHSKGLLFGIYSDAGTKTCEGLPGSWGFERQDAQIYAYWGVDYVKYDFCNMNDATGKPLASAQEAYTRMARELQDTGRAILFSLCSWGAGEPWLWAAPFAHSWRTSRDVFAAWDEADVQREVLPNYLQSVMSAVRSQSHLARYARPGAFNDPDMLVVGLKGMTPYGIVQKCPPHIPDCTVGEYISRERWGMVGGLNADEQRTHFALWCIMAAPLILGNDPRSMDADTLRILTAAEVIGVNQDPLGRQGVRVFADGPVEVWRKVITGCRAAFLLFNTGSQPADVEVVWGRDLGADDDVCVDAYAGQGVRSDCDRWADAGECARNANFMMLKCKAQCERRAAGKSADLERQSCGGTMPAEPEAWRAFARDVWARKDLGDLSRGFTARQLPPHGSALITAKVTAVDPLSDYNCGGEHLGRISRPQFVRNRDGTLTRIQDADPETHADESGTSGAGVDSESSKDSKAASSSGGSMSARQKQAVTKLPVAHHEKAVSSVNEDSHEDEAGIVGPARMGRMSKGDSKHEARLMHALGMPSGVLRAYLPMYIVLCAAVFVVLCRGCLTRCARRLASGSLPFGKTPRRSSRFHTL